MFYSHFNAELNTATDTYDVYCEKFMKEKSKILKTEGLRRWLRGLVGCLVYCQLDTLHLRRRNLN